MAGLFHAVQNQRNPLGTAVRLRGSGRYTFGLALSAGLAGLLYGYDTVSISGAIEFLSKRYHLDSLMEGLVISSIMIGAVIGAAWAGFLSDRFGRRRILITGGTFFCVAAVWSALTFGLYDLILARIVGGFGIGLTAALAVTYITESAPTNIRGTLTFSYQMLTVCGLFLTNVINYIIASHGSIGWDLTIGWRWMLGLGAIPALAFLAAMWRAPESPRYLIQHDRAEEGFRVLERILGTEDARVRTDDIQASVRLEQEMSGEFTDLFRPGLKKALWIGVFLAVFNQAVGINAISYYGPVMFSRMGFAGDTAFLASACVGGVELVFTVIGMFLIDAAGRKRLMAIGSGLITVFALCTSLSYFLGAPLLMLTSIMMFAASFAFSMGPIPWVVIPELFPTFLRGRATGLCIMFLLAVNWAIAQFTPIMIDSLGDGITFLIFGALDAACLAGIILLVPETMGHTLEEIEHLWQPKTPLASAKYALSSADANIRHAEATLARVENERLQAMGILEAAERARITAQKRIFAIEAEERANAERLSAQRQAEEARRAEHTRTDKSANNESTVRSIIIDRAAALASLGIDPSDLFSTETDDTMISRPIPLSHAAHSASRTAEAPATTPDTAASVVSPSAAGALQADAHESDKTYEAPTGDADDADMEHAIAAAVASLPPLPATGRRTSSAPDYLFDDTTGDDGPHAVVSSLIPCPDPATAGRDDTAMLATRQTEDAREARAIDEALDTLDSFIKS